jgi:tetratricopeptide (TPR) repeat protein
MLVRLLLIAILVVVSLFCWVSLENPVDVEFHFFNERISTSVSALMLSSFMLGVLLVFIGTLARDVRRAFQEFRKSRQRRKEERVKEALNRGMDHFIRGDFAKAKNHFIEALRKDPTQIDLYLRLADMNLKEGNDEQALHWLRQARLIDVRNVEILLREADVYQRTKRLDEAIRTLTRVVELDETNLKALRALREIRLEGRQWEEAVRLQKSILKLVEGKPAKEEETLFYLGLKYEHGRDRLNRGGAENLGMALKEAKEIIRERRDFQPGYVLLGDVLLRMGRWAAAGKVWGKGLMRFRSVVFILRLEDLYLGREDPGTLLRIYQKALRQYPAQWPIRFFYAKLCLRLEMLDEALETLEEISVGQQDFPALHRLLAEIHLHKKDFSGAAREFEKSFELSGRGYLPFYCTTCDNESQEWKAFCPQCHQWNTYKIKPGEEAVHAPPPSLAERIPVPF